MLNLGTGQRFGRAQYALGVFTQAIPVPGRERFPPMIQQQPGHISGQSVDLATTHPPGLQMPTDDRLQFPVRAGGSGMLVRLINVNDVDHVNAIGREHVIQHLIEFVRGQMPGHGKVIEGIAINHVKLLAPLILNHILTGVTPGGTNAILGIGIPLPHRVNVRQLAGLCPVLSKRLHLSVQHHHRLPGLFLFVVHRGNFTQGLNLGLQIFLGTGRAQINGSAAKLQGFALAIGGSHRFWQARLRPGQAKRNVVGTRDRRVNFSNFGPGARIDCLQVSRERVRSATQEQCAQLWLGRLFTA